MCVESAAPDMGASTTCGMALSASGTAGSYSYTSRPALPSSPDCSNSIRTRSSMIDPRAIFITIPCGPNALNTSRPTACRLLASARAAITRISAQSANDWFSTSRCGTHGTKAVNLTWKTVPAPSWKRRSQMSLTPLRPPLDCTQETKIFAPLSAPQHPISPGASKRSTIFRFVGVLPK